MTGMRRVTDAQNCARYTHLAQAQTPFDPDPPSAALPDHVTSAFVT